MQERKGDTAKQHGQGRTYITAHVNDPDREIYAWQGNIDGKRPVLMWYKEFDDVVVGKLFYTEQEDAKAIKLIGTKNGTEYKLQEMQPDGFITGFWQLKPDAISIEGTWYTTTIQKIFNASLMHIDTAVSIPAITTRAGISGVYSCYRIYNDSGKPDTMVMSMSVNQTGKDQAVVTYTTGHVNKVLEQRGDTLTLNKNTATRYIESQECDFTIRFFNGFAIAGYVKDSSSYTPPGFVNHTGIYMKVK